MNAMALVNKIALSLSGGYLRLAARSRLWLGCARTAKLLPLLLPLLVYAGAQLYLHRTAVAVLDSLIATLPAGVEFRFDQIDSRFDGDVAIEGATLRLPGMKAAVRFQSLGLVNSRWRELSTMAQALDQGQLPGALRIEFTLTEQALARLSNASVLPVNATLRVLGCFRPAVLRAAPETEGKALFSGSLVTGNLEYRFDTQTEYLNARLELGAPERYRLVFNADLDVRAPQLRLSALDRIGLGGAALQYINQGAQTALLYDCGATGRSGLVEGVYVARQADQLRQRLSRQGWLASTELELAYQDYLFLPLRLSLQLSAAKAVDLLELARSPVSWGQFGVRIGLNTPEADHQGLTWQPDTRAHTAEETAPEVRSAALTPALTDRVLPNDSGPENKGPEKKGPEKKGLEPPAKVRLVKPDRATISAAPRPSLLQPELRPAQGYQPAYKPVSIRALPGLLGAPLRLTTLNGRRIEGVLQRVELDRLQLRSELAEGTAILPVRLDIIRAMQAYF
ncbi:MAG: hypothetical protein ACI9W6_000298 [Motiliproteus sp.]|jgi:hypothetical protein